MEKITVKEWKKTRYQSTYVNKEPIPELITAPLNLELGIINEFLIMGNSSEILIDLRIKLVLG
jgi:hypothetical protein